MNFFLVIKTINYYITNQLISSKTNSGTLFSSQGLVKAFLFKFHLIKYSQN